MTIPSLLDAAVKRLVKSEPGWKPADPAPPKGAKQPEVSTGRPSAGGSSVGALAVGDLVELDYSARLWWDEYTVPTTDGIFSIRWRDPKRFVLDNTGATINLDLAEPT